MACETFNCEKIRDKQYYGKFSYLILKFSLNFEYFLEFSR